MVDPIDGTRAFANGLPEFAISVALLRDGAPVLGVVLNPATGECFEAERGCGAWCGGARLRVCTHDALQGARLLSSWTEMRRRSWPALMPKATFTDLSSLAYKLALVAAGRFDGLIARRNCDDWDVAAAQLLIAGARGQLTRADGGASGVEPAGPASLRPRGGRRRAPASSAARAAGNRSLAGAWANVTPGPLLLAGRTIFAPHCGVLATVAT
jgi:myo-inositol-1(or 4)-monophosphatase